jgi:Undecaprenyl-phosphate galactose phosphotransferase WbaP
VGSIIEEHCRDFSRIIVIPDLFNISTLWINAIDFGGILGLDVAQRLLDARRQAFKRIFEIMIVLVTTPMTVPLLVFLALAIKIDDRGPVFFRQERIGRGGVPFRIWKFRTMIPGAETVIMDYLEKNPHLRQEWGMTRKLSQDPRITRIGKMLRKTSLDELPQLFNVICGDLSLVGPRPIVAEEAEKYKEVFDLYKKVRPGITGLWQISGRSNTAYDERVDLDSYYVRNWSILFDIYILAMTPKVVFTGHGAC